MKFTTVTWYSQVAAILLAVGIFTLGIYLGIMIERLNQPVTESPTATTTVDTAVIVSPIIGVELGSQIVKNEEEIPISQVYVTATRENGDIKRIFLKEVQGSCNIVSADPLIERPTDEFLCYYAGFGEVFRIRESQTAFYVEKKDIEEASPEYNPPLMEFVLLEEIPK